uniref:Uncharacterized protein n=1 Tax=Anguilla anguilla TaxID=7936 RepID=A0A0E9V1L1_ANGAN
MVCYSFLKGFNQRSCGGKIERSFVLPDLKPPISIISAFTYHFE